MGRMGTASRFLDGKSGKNIWLRDVGNNVKGNMK
jgi:hypothetical protein